MTPAELFENAIGWLWEHYSDLGFYLERDVAWTIQKHIAREIDTSRLPYRVVHEYSVNGARADLVILNEGTIDTVVEFKYEPHRSRSIAGKLPVTEWRAVVKDVRKSIERVEHGEAKAAYSAFIDEGGYFHERREAPTGSEWRDWGDGRWVLWAQVGTSR